MLANLGQYLMTPRIFDRDLLVRRRDRIASGAHAHDFLLARVADEITARLSAINRQFTCALDLGCHHGVLARALSVPMVVAADASPAMLARCPAPRVLADEEALPFRDGAFDLVVSGLSLHLVNDLPGTLVQIRRALRPDGLLLATLIGGQSLRELREAMLIAESEIDGGASPRVAPFADIRDLGTLLGRTGFALTAVDADMLTVTWPSALALMRELKAMGLSNMLVERRRTPMTRTLLARACAVYEERFADADGRVPATFELLTLTGWAPDPSQQQPARRGSATVSMTQILAKGG